MMVNKQNLRFIISLSFLVFACSNNYYLKREKPHPEYIEQINYLGESNSARLLLVDNKQLKVEKIEISDTSVIFEVADSAHFSTLHYDQIKRITFRDHKAGIGYGMMVGAGMGVIFGLITIDRSKEMAGMGVLVYGGVGLLVGTSFGVFAGSDRNYIFTSEN